MITLSVTVSGAQVASQLDTDPEEMALFLKEYADRTTSTDLECLVDHIEDLSKEDQERIRTTLVAIINLIKEGHLT